MSGNHLDMSNMFDQEKKRILEGNDEFDNYILQGAVRCIFIDLPNQLKALNVCFARSLEYLKCGVHLFLLYGKNCIL